MNGGAGLAAGGAASAAIETRELRKEFGRIVALAGLTMTVPRGEVFGFLGPNGAGKTTAVKLLLGLSAPTAGNGRVLGAPLGDVGTRRRIGYLPELFRYQGWMTAREVLAFHCRLAKMPRSDWQAEINEALDLVGLSDQLDHFPAQLSGGEQQRVAIARAIAGEQRFLLADVPTGNLDSLMARQIMDLLAEINRQGTTIVLVTHDPELARRAHRNIHVMDGQVTDLRPYASRGAVPGAAVA
jgi:putative ABC transport system ATP-binding protein